MTTFAANFTQKMKRIWNGQEQGNEDANIEARVYGAIRARPFATEEWYETPGDIAASLWNFRDGSECVIFDDGSCVHRARTTRGKYNERMVESA